MRLAAILLAACVAFTTAPAASAHEFWIEPQAFRIEPGEAVRGDLKVGQNFKGNVFPYLRNRFVSFRMTGRETESGIENYDGASPSFDLRDADEGLVIVSYLSTADRLIYRDWDTFLAYAEYEGLQWAVDAHRQRGLPERDFSETFVRCAKALIQVGPADSQDRDRAVGLPLELVAQANPYDAPLDRLAVQLLWQGKPLRDIQVAIFQKTEGSAVVRRAVIRTDANGMASVPLAGGGRFLLNAVRLEAAEAGSGDEWHSHWASLTFAVSGKGEP